VKDFAFMRMFLSTVYYGWRYLLLGKKMYLWSPIPSIATHLEREYISPTIDWEKYFDVTI